MNKKTKLIGAILPLFVSLFVASCAQDGFDEESWSSSVRDQVLQSPSSDAIVADKNADGSSWIITWPLVKGASGFKCTVKDVTDKAKEPVVIFQDSIVDGCSLTFPRAEDTFYELEILALGKQELNNQDAPEASLFAFNSFVPTWKTVPAGSDIATSSFVRSRKMSFTLLPCRQAIGQGTGWTGILPKESLSVCTGCGWTIPLTARLPIMFLPIGKTAL